jgi:hypothetical protein
MVTIDDVYINTSTMVFGDNYFNIVTVLNWHNMGCLICNETGKCSLFSVIVQPGQCMQPPTGFVLVKGPLISQAWHLCTPAHGTVSEYVTDPSRSLQSKKILVLCTSVQTMLAKFSLIAWQLSCCQALLNMNVAMVCRWRRPEVLQIWQLHDPLRGHLGAVFFHDGLSDPHLP